MRKISLFEEDVFWKLLESFICISYHENCFEQYFCRKFQVFKNSDFQLFQLIKAVSRPIENEQLLGQNSLPFSNPLISRNLFFKILRSLLNSFRPIKFQLQFTKCNCYCLVGFVFRETKKNAWVKRGWGWRRESARKGTTRDMQQSIFRRSNVNFINTVAHMGEKKPFILERNEHWRTFIAIGLKGKSISSAFSLLCRLYIHVCFFNKTTPIISNWDISMKCN